jgi:hypothetical protein
VANVQVSGLQEVTRPAAAAISPSSLQMDAPLTSPTYTGTEPKASRNKSVFYVNKPGILQKLRPKFFFLRGNVVFVKNTYVLQHEPLGLYIACRKSSDFGCLNIFRALSFSS